jgi:hypothetical protein
VTPGAHIRRRVIKGGSHLCAELMAALPTRRTPTEAIDTSASHIGFRFVLR